jgi:NAD(P)H-hydrate repair Nnr-like enzyme with NAD(P)H-hydrate epimerase domain
VSYELRTNSALLIEANGDIVAVEAPGANGGDGIVLQRYLAN